MNDTDDLLEQARADASSVPRLLRELEDRRGSVDTAIRVAALALELSLPVLIGRLGRPDSAWADDVLYGLLFEPDTASFPALSEESAAQLSAALESNAAFTAAIVCLRCGVQPLRARDVLTKLAAARLDEPDNVHEGVIDYDFGCQLQEVVVALRSAPLSDAVVALLDRIYAGADGPLTSVVVTSLIRPSAPLDVLRRWKPDLRSYSVDAYTAARDLELDCAIAVAEGAETIELVELLLGAAPEEFFVQIAAVRCLNALAAEQPDDVLEALVDRLDSAEHVVTLLGGLEPANYEGAFGPARNLRRALSHCWSLERDTASAAAAEVGETVAHQGSLYPATVIALPQIITLTSDPHVVCRDTLREWLAVIRESAESPGPVETFVSATLAALDEQPGAFAVLSRDEWEHSLRRQAVAAEQVRCVLRIVDRS